MPDRPLIIFPQPEEASRSKLGGGPGRIKKPSHQRQSDRLSPLFNALQAAFNTRRADLLQATPGIDPEQVLIIETVGSIEEFVKAIRKIEGLEWMGELEVDEITPDEDFFVTSKPEKELSGRLYLIMTNQRALEEMLSLWRQYVADPGMKFQRGLTKFRDVFICLKSIRRWEIQDRLLETGVLEAWNEDLEHMGDRPIRFETELWFRGNNEKRQESQRTVIEQVNRLGGNVLGQCIIEEIAYHGLLAELPASEIQNIVNNP